MKGKKRSRLPRENADLSDKMSRRQHDKSLNHLHREIGVKLLAEALEYAEDAPSRQLLADLFNPAYRFYSFAALCRKSGLTLGDVVDLFRRYKLDESILKMAASLPGIVEDTTLEARSSLSKCKTCAGSGLLILEDGAPLDCDECGGSGKIRVKGDKDARDLVFESMGLTGKKGPAVVIQQNFRDTFERSVEAAEKLVLEDREPSG